jgi:sulfate transport system substrate-binding protein
MHAEPPVAVVDKIVDQKKTRDIAEEYLKFLYSKEAQELIAKNYYRPTDLEISRKYIRQFPYTKLLNVADYGGWETLQSKHFSDGGTFDKIYNVKK